MVVVNNEELAQSAQSRSMLSQHHHAMNIIMEYYYDM